MPLEEFNCVVLGNEPAGLWLLSQISGSFSQSNLKPRFGWLQIGKAPSPLAVPRWAAEPFQLQEAPQWHAELISPRRNLLWETESLRNLFPELSTLLDSKEIPHHFGHPQAGELKTIRRVLQKHPELLGYASGIWKHFGRTQRLHPEMLIWSTLLCRDLMWWNPQASLPKEVETVELTASHNRVEGIERLKEGGVCIKFQNQTPILARKWLFNLPYQHIRAMDNERRELSTLLALDEDMRSSQSLYVFQVEAQRQMVPKPMRPLTVMYDTEVIPDWGTEIWPVRLTETPDHKVLEFRVSAPRPAAIETILEGFRQALGRIHRLCPFIAESAVNYSYPLSVETCASQEQRIEITESLEMESIELYDRTSFLTGTRQKGVSAVLPFLNCHLPYPLGSLTSARLVLKDFLKKKTTNKSPPPQEKQP